MERLRLLEGELKHTESYQARLRHLSKRQLATFAKGLSTSSPPLWQVRNTSATRTVRSASTRRGAR